MDEPEARLLKLATTMSSVMFQNPIPYMFTYSTIVVVPDTIDAFQTPLSGARRVWRWQSALELS
jgi:hypothetical protein